MEVIHDTIICAIAETAEKSDPGTVRPDVQPQPTKGTHFKPMQLVESKPVIQDLPTTAFNLFLLFLPLQLLTKWASWTNAFAESRKPSQQDSHTRLNQWSNTSRDEILFFVGILIYMTYNPRPRFTDYWNHSNENAIYPFTRFIPLRRFELLYRHIRIFPSDQSIYEQAKMPKVYQQVAEWSDHIQEISCQLLRPGSCLTVDECMVRYTGRSSETTTIPTKPIPLGFKIWGVASDCGYFFCWLWHIVNKGPVGLDPTKRLPPQPRRRIPALTRAEKAVLDPEVVLNPTQRVVTTLLNKVLARWPDLQIHVFLDNLFSSLHLFSALRRKGIAATGTCNIKSGIWEDFVRKKKDDEKRDYIPWGTLETAPSVDNQVNQIIWKDNALTMFLSTIYTTSEEQVIRNRKRPKLTSTSAKTARKVFGSAPRKELPIPQLVDEYNHHMGAIDIGDQRHSIYCFNHPVRRGSWQAIAWQFLLEVCLTNSFLLQWMCPSEPKWKRFKDQRSWREHLATHIIKTYGPRVNSRKRSLDGYSMGISMEDSVQEHKRVHRGKRSNCQACLGHSTATGIVARPAKRVALGEVDDNACRVRTTTRFGCADCGVPLCNNIVCWNKWHRLN